MRNSDDLERLIAQARHVNMSAADIEAQRRSFAYGNAKIENARITRTLVDQQAERLKRQPSK